MRFHKFLIENQHINIIQFFGIEIVLYSVNYSFLCLKGIFMTKIKNIIAITALCSSFASAADIVGNDMSVHRAYPTASQDYVAPKTTTVAIGAGDAVTSQFANVDIDPGTVTLDFNFSYSTSFVGSSGGTFDGHVIRGFGGDLTDAQLISSDFSFTDLTFDGDAIYLNLGGGVSGNMKIEIEFTTASSTEPPNGSTDTGKIKRLYTDEYGNVAIALDNNMENAFANGECPNANTWAGVNQMNINMLETIILAQSLNSTVTIVTSGCESNWLKLTSITIEQPSN